MTNEASQKAEQSRGRGLYLFRKSTNKATKQSQKAGGGRCIHLQRRQQKQQQSRSQKGRRGFTSLGSNKAGSKPEGSRSSRRGKCNESRKGVLEPFKASDIRRYYKGRERAKKAQRRGKKSIPEKKPESGGGSGTRSSRKPEGRKRRRGASLCQIFSRKAAAGLLASWLLLLYLKICCTKLTKCIKRVFA